MYSTHRFLYGTAISSLIAWTIYLLTIDFYSSFFISYQYKHIIYIPLIGEKVNFYFLAVLNMFTLLVSFGFLLIKSLKNAQSISS